MIRPSNSTIKLLCSYGGTILPSFQDHEKLRYYGGHTRVLSIDRSIPFSELMVKLKELCGALVSSIRCQLPSEEVEALVSITCNDDVLNLIEEYDKAAAATKSATSTYLKIRTFLSQPKSVIKKVSPPHSVSPTYIFRYQSSFNTPHSSRDYQSRISTSNHSSCLDKYSGRYSTLYESPCTSRRSAVTMPTFAQDCRYAEKRKNFQDDEDPKEVNCTSKL